MVNIAKMGRRGTNELCLPGAALGRFDRLLQIGPRAERGPAFFFSKGDNLGHLDPLAAGPRRDLADAITCVHSASQRPAVKPVVTRLINNVSFPPKHQRKTWYVLASNVFITSYIHRALGASECHTFKYSVYGISLRVCFALLVFLVQKFKRKPS